MTNAPAISGDFDGDKERAHRLVQQRERMAAYRERRRRGHVQVRVDVTREQMAALERLGLFDADAGISSLAWAVGRYLDSARHVVAVGDALYPVSEGREP